MNNALQVTALSVKVIETPDDPIILSATPRRDLKDFYGATYVEGGDPVPIVNLSLPDSVFDPDGYAPIK